MISVIVGPPCAGKSTFVARSARPGDVIVDYDAMARALGSDRLHEAPGAVADVAFHAREAAVSRILAKRWDAWIIHTSPSKSQVSRYLEAGCRILLIDPGEDECVARAERDNRPPGTCERIHRWYEMPPNLLSDWRSQ